MQLPSVGPACGQGQPLAARLRGPGQEGPACLPNGLCLFLTGFGGACGEGGEVHSPRSTAWTLTSWRPLSALSWLWAPLPPTFGQVLTRQTGSSWGPVGPSTLSLLPAHCTRVSMLTVCLPHGAVPTQAALPWVCQAREMQERHRPQAETNSKGDAGALLSTGRVVTP